MGFYRIFQSTIIFHFSWKVQLRGETHQDPCAQDNPPMLHIKYWRYAIRRLLGYFLPDQQLPPSSTSPFTVRIDTRLRVCFDNASPRRPPMAIVAPVIQ